MEDKLYLDLQSKVGSVIDTVVLVEVVVDLPDGGKYTYTSGGVCVSEDGLIVTAFHCVEDDPANVKVKFCNSSTWMKANVLYEYSEAELAVLELSDWKGGVKFPYVDVPETISLDWGDRVFSFSHSMEFFFSPSYGRVAYPFARDVEIPTLSSEPRLVERRIFTRTAIFKPVPSLKSRFTKSLKCLHPDLPLIKTHGTNIHQGSSGCPLFRRSQERKLLGICSFGNDPSMYFIPAPVIAKALKGYGTI